jgi:hypothetical protein
MRVGDCGAMSVVKKMLRRPIGGGPAGGSTNGEGEAQSEFNLTVEPADVHSHAKLCLEASMNAPGSTPPLRGELGGLGIGLRTLLAVAPVNNCTALASLAVSSGCFPPLRWEVCTSRKENKPLSLSVVAGEGGLADCIGACFHTDWMWPSVLYSDRRDFVVPLFAKLAAVYIYATEEKDIMNSDAVVDMAGLNGTAASGHSSSSANARRRWKFTGQSYGGCVASVCCLLMPSAFVSSLVTFGSPPTFSSTDNILPFPHTHIQHANDLTPHLFVRAAAGRIAARLTGLGYLIPDPPLNLPSLDGRVNKRGEFIDLYRHHTAHVLVLTPSAAQVSYGTALRKQEQQIERGRLVVGAERLPAPGNTTAILVATSSLFDRRHGPVPDTIAKMMPRQQVHVMPRLEGPGKIATFDVRQQTLKVNIRDYFLPLRTLLGKRVELTPSLASDGFQSLSQFLNNNGECATKRLAADILNFTSYGTQLPANPNNLSSVQVTMAEQVVLLGYKCMNNIQSTGNILGGGTTDEDGAPASPSQPPPPAHTRANAAAVDAAKPKITIDSTAQHPPLWISTQLELCSDTFEGLVTFLAQLRQCVGWNPEQVARQLAAWSGGLPIASMVASAFISSQWLAVHVCPPVRRAPLSRHVSTAAICDNMDSTLRAVLSSPEGHHFEWSIAVASVTHGVGKSTLLHLLTREVIQSRFGPDDELETANRRAPARRGAAQEAVLRLKWSWAAAVEGLKTQQAAGSRAGGVSIAAVPMQFGDDAMYHYEYEGGPRRESEANGKGEGRSNSKTRKPAKETSGGKPPAAKKEAKQPAAAKKGDAKAAAPAAAAGVEEPPSPPPEQPPSPVPEPPPEDAEAVLQLTEAAKRHILPPSLLLRLHLDELYFDGGFAAMKRLGRYAQVLWIVNDAFTADRFAAAAPQLQHAFCSFQQHAVLYCPRRHAAGQAGAKPLPSAATPAAAATQNSVSATPFLDAAMVNDTLSTNEADRIHVEMVLQRLQRQYHLRVAHIEVVPHSSQSIQGMNATSQHMLNLQRLLMQWMVPRLPLPVDPHNMPGGVDIGALFTRCDSVVADYLRTSTECHLMGAKQQRAFLMQQALVRQQGGVRRKTLAGTHYSLVSYDDVERGAKVVAAPTSIPDDDMEPSGGDPTSPDGVAGDLPAAADT